MITTVIESPLSGDMIRNTAYAELAMLDSFARGEAPFASHVLFPHVLNELDPEQREQGIEAGFAIGARLESRAVYVDLGLSGGMRRGVAQAHDLGQTLDRRMIVGIETLLEQRVRATHRADAVDEERLRCASAICLACERYGKPDVVRFKEGDSAHLHRELGDKTCAAWKIWAVEL